MTLADFPGIGSSNLATSPLRFIVKLQMQEYSGDKCVSVLTLSLLNSERVYGVPHRSASATLTRPIVLDQKRGAETSIDFKEVSTRGAIAEVKLHILPELIICQLFHLSQITSRVEGIFNIRFQGWEISVTDGASP